MEENKQIQGQAQNNSLTGEEKAEKLKEELMKFYQEQIRKEDIEINNLKAKLKIHQVKRKRYVSERSKYSGKAPNKRVKKIDK